MKKLNLLKSVLTAVAATLILASCGSTKIPEHLEWHDNDWTPMFNSPGAKSRWETTNDNAILFTCKDNTKVNTGWICSDYYGKDVYGFEASVRKDSGASNGSMGFYFGADVRMATSTFTVNDGYLLLLSTHSNFQLVQFVNGERQLLCKWTQNKSIKRGFATENTVKVEYRDGYYFIYANDELITSIKDVTQPGGSVIPYVWIPKDAEPATQPEVVWFKFHKFYY